jgi:hypothetical protein
VAAQEIKFVRHFLWFLTQAVLPTSFLYFVS